MKRLFLSICGGVFVSLYATSTLLAADNINVELSEGVLGGGPQSLDSNWG